LVIDNVLLDEGFFDEFKQIVASCHFVDVYDSLDEIIGFAVVSLKSEELTDRVKRVDMLRVHLTEIEKSIDVVGVADKLVLSLDGVVLLAGLETDGIVFLHDLELLAEREVFGDAL
jgi:hypothetical protein